MVVPPTIELANLGMADTLILMVLALVVFGPRRLPQIGRQIGKLMYEFRKASNDFKFQMEEELRNAEEADRRRKEDEERQRQLAAAPPAQLEAGTATVAETPSTENVDLYSGTYGETPDMPTRAEAAYPSIQPPSTGEPIPAGWPANDIPDAGVIPDTGASTGGVEAGSTEASAPAQESHDAPVAVAEESPALKVNTVTEAAVEGTSTATETNHNG